MPLDLGSFGDAALPPAPAARQVPRPGPPRRLRVRVVAVLVLAACVAGGDLVVAQARRSGDDGPGPTATAQRFYDAVRAGDATTALAQLDLPAGTDRRLLTARALAGPRGLTPAGATLATHRGDDATVFVDYSVAVAGDVAFGAVELTLHRSRGGPLHDRVRWRIVGGLPTITVTAPALVTDLTVAGTPVHLTGGSATLPAFPGLVPVASAASPLLAAATGEVVAGGASDPTTPTVPARPSAAAERVATAAVAAAFARRADRLDPVAEVSSVDEGVTVRDGALDLQGSIEQKDAAGTERAWASSVTVTVVAGAPVATGAVVTRADVPAGIDPLAGF